LRPNIPCPTTLVQGFAGIRWFSKPHLLRAFVFVLRFFRPTRGARHVALSINFLSWDAAFFFCFLPTCFYCTPLPLSRVCASDFFLRKERTARPVYDPAFLFLVVVAPSGPPVLDPFFPLGLLSLTTPPHGVQFPFYAGVFRHPTQLGSCEQFHAPVGTSLFPPEQGVRLLPTRPRAALRLPAASTPHNCPWRNITPDGTLSSLRDSSRAPSCPCQRLFVFALG